MMNRKWKIGVKIAKILIYMMKETSELSLNLNAEIIGPDMTTTCDTLLVSLPGAQLVPPTLLG